MKPLRIRPRRLRRHPALRELVAETSLSPGHLVAPLFVKEGLKSPHAIRSMPGQFQHSLKSLLKEAAELVALGVPGVLLFGIPARKDERGSGAADPKGVVPQAIRMLKAKYPKLAIMADVCLCEYTSHGHCGIFHKGEVLNDPTVAALSEAARVYADAGADVVAPSDMMDGRVRAIRSALDAAAHEDCSILSYAVKYASSFYGPFRDAAENKPVSGDRRGYQMDPANWREAMKEARLDLAEGADFILVKPAMPCLDILVRLKEKLDCPIGAYQVSGEYSAICAAAANGWIDERRAALESLTAIRRAGADFSITYWAKPAARWMSA
jgi:porphobilinogen synthase